MPFKLDWFDLLAAQGTLRSILQHHSSKASILWRSASFMVWLSQLYVTTGKIIDLTLWTFVGRVMSLLFNTLSRFVIAFLPRSNHLLMAWLRPPSSVILEPKRKSVATFPPFICHGNEYVFCYPNVMDRRALNIHLHNKLLATGLVSTKIPQSTIRQRLSHY